VKAMKIVLIILICLGSLCTLYLGFVFFIGSGFIFAGDIDLSDEQRKSAEIWVAIGTIFGLFLMLISLMAVIFSSVISKFILKLFGSKNDG
jgi:hypothetical protein